MNTPIANLHPHYTNERFKRAQVVWGREVDGLNWVYSDRLWEWDYEKHASASEIAKEKVGSINTAAYFQEYLSAYFDKRVKIVCIMAGHNLSNGYSYQVFGYREVEK